MTIATAPSKTQSEPRQFGRAWLTSISRGRAKFLRGPLMIAASLIIFFVLWELLSTFVFNPYLIPPPTRVFETAVPMIVSGEIFRHAGISLMRVLVGFSLGASIAIVVGVIMGRLKVVNELLDPIIEKHAQILERIALLNSSQLLCYECVRPDNAGDKAPSN